MVIPTGQRAEWSPPTKLYKPGSFIAVANLAILLPLGIFIIHSYGHLNHLHIQLVNLFPESIHIPSGTHIADIEDAVDVSLKPIKSATDLRQVIQELEPDIEAEDQRTVATVTNISFTDDDFLKIMDDTLSEPRRQQLLAVLLKNADLFARTS